MSSQSSNILPIRLEFPKLPSFQQPKAPSKKSVASKRPLTMEQLSQRRRIRYTLGCLTAVALVMGAKKLLGRLPILGPFLSPLLSVVPTLATGIVLGSAVVYGIEEGDLTAGPRRLRHEARRIGREIEGTVDDVHSDLGRISRKHDQELVRMASSIEETVNKDLVPSIRRTARGLVREMELNMADLQEEVRRGARRLEQSLKG